MKEMKNIKTPAYAMTLGTGVFMAAGPTYQCKYCGKKSYMPTKPYNTAMMPCEPGRSSHTWVKC